MSPTPIEWQDEPQRMGNVLTFKGCPHGRIDLCLACEELEAMARGVWEDDGWNPGEGGEFDEGLS